MIKPILTAFAFVAASAFSNSFSQDEISSSKEFTYEVSAPYPSVNVGFKKYYGVDGKVTAIKMDSKSFNVQQFDGKTLNQTQIQVYNDIEEKANYEGELISGTNIYYFFSLWDKATETEQLFMYTINTNTGKRESNKIIINTAKGKVANNNNGPRYLFKKSFDESKILIQYRLKPANKNDDKSTDVIGCIVLNQSDLSKIWNKEVTMPYTEAQMNNIAYAITGDGSIFILTEVFKSGNRQRYSNSDVPNFEIELIEISENGNNVKSSNMSTEGKFVNQIGFFEGKDKTLLLAGYYCKTKSSKVDGVFLIKLNSDGDQENMDAYEIPSEIMKQYTSERQQNKIDKQEENGNDVSMKDFYLSDVRVDTDGSIVLTGEKYFSTVRYSSQTNLSTYTYYYQEMLLAKINPNGELSYMKKLPKNQIGITQNSSNTGSSRFTSSSFDDLSFKLISTEKYYYTVFLDNEKNNILEMDKFPAKQLSGYPGIFSAYQINKVSGEVKKLAIFHTKNAKGIKIDSFSIQNVTEIGANAFALECFKMKKEDVMIKVVIED